MPHFIINCSYRVIEKMSPEELMQIVYDEAVATQLFTSNEIKVRLSSFEHYNTGNTKGDFIHVFADIMEGRSDKQKHSLAIRIVKGLTQSFQDVPVISINVRDFEKASYVKQKNDLKG